MLRCLLLEQCLCNAVGCFSIELAFFRWEGVNFFCVIRKDICILYSVFF